MRTFYRLSIPKPAKRTLEQKNEDMKYGTIMTFDSMALEGCVCNNTVRDYTGSFL